MSAVHREWVNAQAAQAHEGPQTAEDWGNALETQTPEMLAAAERLRQSINQRRAERQEVSA